MGELQQQPPPSPSPVPLPTASDEAPPPPPPKTAAPDDPQPTPQSKPSPPRFDPSRMIGIIRRKALIKDLAAVYHAECLAYCQELLELQRKCEEKEVPDVTVMVRAKLGPIVSFQRPYIDVKTTEDSRKETMRPPKRLKKAR